MSRPTLHLPAHPAARASLGGIKLGPAAAGPSRVGRWALGGVVVGLGLSLLANLPAAWLAEAVDQATAGRLQLSQAEGSLWQGSALPLLTGGPGSRDLAVLPSRLAWRLRPMWDGVRLSLSQDCCIPGELALELRPGWKRLAVSVLPQTDVIGQWPAGWLEGLGAPWNTLKPGGQIRLAAQQVTLQLQDQTWQLTGRAELSLLQASSRLSTLGPLGSYQLSLTGQPHGPALLSLTTLSGALQFTGQGELRPRGLYFRGQAQATAGQEPALNNLLNIIGRRQGALSVISIG